MLLFSMSVSRICRLPKMMSLLVLLFLTAPLVSSFNLSSPSTYLSTYSRRSTSVSTTALFSSSEETNPLPDRILSCFPYLLPLADGCSFGRYIYERVPPLGVLERATLQPLSDLFQSIPFSSLIVFVAFSFAARQPGLPRYVRFNIQQAILLDIALVFPSLFGSAADNLPRYLVEPATNFVFYAFVAATGERVREAKPDDAEAARKTSYRRISHRLLYKT